MKTKNLKRYAERQIRLLESMAHLVKCSGIMVYAVCSNEPEENEVEEEPEKTEEQPKKKKRF